jgi:hypothetical protein
LLYSLTVVDIKVKIVYFCVGLYYTQVIFLCTTEWVCKGLSLKIEHNIKGLNTIFFRKYLCRLCLCTHKLNKSLKEREFYSVCEGIRLSRAYTLIISEKVAFNLYNSTFKPKIIYKLIFFPIICYIYIYHN